MSAVKKINIDAECIGASVWYHTIQYHIIDTRTKLPPKNSTIPLSLALSGARGRIQDTCLSCDSVPTFPDDHDENKPLYYYINSDFNRHGDDRMDVQRSCVVQR